MIKEKIEVAMGRARADVVIKQATILNVFTEQFEVADIAIRDGMIVGLGAYEGECEVDATGKTVVPGFIDGHVHLESSIVSPRQYARAVVPHGTTAVVTDPHEITNVLGKAGFRYIMEASEGLPLDVYLMVPSCVPATPFDEAGAVLTAEDIRELLPLPRVLGLAEMMNYPGVCGGDPATLDKVAAARAAGKPVDGHAPGLTGAALNAYIAAGITSDHECTTAEEAMEKISRGQWVMVRKGTAGKNAEALLPLFQKPYCDRCMLVTDDKHPGELMREGHIDHIVRYAIERGVPLVNAYKMASFNAAAYFGLKQNGAIAPGYYADFVILDDPRTVAIHAVYKRGRRVDDTVNDLSAAPSPLSPMGNTVQMQEVTPAHFALKGGKAKVIGLLPGEILTRDAGEASAVDPARDIAKLAVIERHHATGHMGVAFVEGYGLQRGAVATSVAHDSHNVIVAGASNEDMAYAVSCIKAMQGGMVVVEGGEVKASLALPIAGLMCDLDAPEAERKLNEVKEAAYALGVHRNMDPFMTLSFASLPVIPHLRLTTFGVVDVLKFALLDDPS